MYIVLEQAFEYNDETYYTGNNGYGKPLKSFKTKKEADAYAEKCNIDWLLETELRNWFYSPDEFFKDFEEIKYLFNYDEDEYGCSIKDTSVESLRKILSKIETKMFFVVKLD